MVLAFAVLFLQIAPAMQTVPKAVIAAGEAIRPKAELPSAPIPKTVTADLANVGSPDRPVLVAERGGAAAGNVQAFETIHVPQLPPAKPMKVLGVEPVPSRRTWLILSIANHSAAAFDAYTTRSAIERGAVEADPLIRPFAGSAGLYAAIQVAPLALDYIARKMQRSQNGLLRRAWWLPQSASTGLFLVAGAHNLTVARP